MRALLAALLLAIPAAHGHDLHHTVSEGPAVVVQLFHDDDDSDFAFESYEVYRDGEAQPYQVGRTDGRSRLAFLPDRAGTWQVKVFSADGHGVDLRLTTGAAGHLEGAEQPFYQRHGRIVAGVAVIFGLFGLLDLYLRHRRTARA